MAQEVLKPLPPKEAIAFFNAKGLRESYDFRDLEAVDHVRAFTVAKSSGARAVLQEVHEMLSRAIAEGSTIDRFRKELKPRLQALGWWGRKELVDPQTGEVRTVQLGSSRRLDTIYETNLRTAYNAGRWQRFEKTKDRFDLVYHHTEGERFPRPEHVAWDGVTLPFGDAWWKTHFTPNGWGCKCYVTQVRKGGPLVQPAKFPPKPWTNPRTGQVAVVESGIDPSFNANPGLEYLKALTPAEPNAGGEPMPRAVAAIAELVELAAPRAGPALLPASATVEEGRAAFLGGFGLAPVEAKALTDVGGEPLVVGPGLFEGPLGRPARLTPAQIRALPLVGQALRHPDEIRWVWRVTPAGKSLLMRRYIARIKPPHGKAVTVVVDMAAGGSSPSWDFATSLDADFGTDPDAFRLGVSAWSRPAG